MNETYTVKQVAEILGYSTNSIYSFLKEGRIKGVRLGKGRFRITQEELGRVLHLSKKPAVLPGQKIKEESQIAPLLIPSVAAIPIDIHFDIRSLFDWFVGAASIVSGVSIFLFTQSVKTAGTETFLVWLPTIQVSLLLGGLGLILSDILTDRISILWHKAFHLVLILTYFALGFLRLQTGDGGATIITWTLAFVMSLNLFRLVKGMESFLFFVIILNCVVPFSLLVNLEAFQAPPILQFMLVNPTLYFAAWLILSIVFGVVILWSHHKKRIIFWVCMAISGVTFIAASFYLVRTLAWGKSFFMVVAGLTCFLVPAWESLHMRNRTERKTILPIFASAIFLLLLVVGSIFFVEQNIKEYVSKELFIKAGYGEVVIDSTMASIEKIVENLGRSETLVGLIEEGDGDKIKDVLKIFFEGNQFIRRLVLLNEDGNLVSVYPNKPLMESNFSFRDYFKEVKRTRSLYLSDIFEAKAEDKRKVMVVSGPIVTKEDEFKGVVAASVDLDRLTVRLQKIANETSEEYFVLIDKNLSWITHPDKAMIGKKVDGSNIVSQYQGERDAMAEGYDIRGVRALQVFHRIEKNGWYALLQAPLVRIMAPTRAMSIGLFLLISILVLAIGGFVLVVRGRAGIRLGK